MHPSVAAFARTLLAGTHISYDGDPLRDLTLTAFLDKFVQRKPKVCYQLPSPVQSLHPPEVFLAECKPQVWCMYQLMPQVDASSSLHCIHLSCYQ